MISRFIFPMRIMTISALLFLQFSAPAFAVPAKVGTYEELVHAIREVRSESQKRVEQAVGQEKVREAWETGKLIDEHILLHKERAEYGKEVMKRLSIDLGISERELYYRVEFAKAYPNLRTSANLSWAHYESLLRINDLQERSALTERAEKEKWTVKEIRREIKKLKAGAAADFPADTPLKAKPGIPGTYRVLKATVGEYKGEPVLDLGFSCYFKPEKETGLKEGDIVTAARDANGNDSLQIVPSPHPLPGGEDKGEGVLYTYQADVVEVIDGDTLKVSIPLGFGFTIVQKLRLRGLDTPEIESAEGKEAKAFLEQKLKTPGNGERETHAKTVGRVLIRTTKSDKYDRYLADVFIDRRPQARDRSRSEVSSPQSDFVYVNQALLDEGLAVRVQS